MKTNAAKADGFPKTIKEGHARVTIYWQPNPSRTKNPQTGAWEATGKVFDQYLLGYYQGTEKIVDKKTCKPLLDEATGQPKLDSKGKPILDLSTGQLKEVPKFIRKKFGNLADAEREARFVLAKLANAEGEILKLTGLDRSSYVRAMQQLRGWREDADLHLTVTDYLAAVSRLPAGTTLQQAVDEYLRRHPAGLPSRTVQQVVDELVAAKAAAGRSQAYGEELKKRLGRFAKSFAVPIASVTGAQIGEWIQNLGLSGRSQINFRRIIGTLFKFAKRRGYLPKDWDEMGAVERPDDDSGEIEVFSPSEMRRLLAACSTPVKERGTLRTREEMIPYLAIGAFAGLRSAEIARLDWSEVHLTGPERFIEVKASKSKTASRRIVPVSDNLAAWLAPHARPDGQMVPYLRFDKQLFQFIAPTAGVTWKRNALRHSFISYRVATIKNVHQVSLEAGNSANMIFKHYRQLVTETAATEWFGIMPPEREGAEIIPFMATPKSADDQTPHGTSSTTVAVAN